MSVFIPQEWEERNEHDHSIYAIKNDLLNYVQKEADGSIDLNDKKLVGLGEPMDDNDAVSKVYLEQHLSKPVMCISAEAVGALQENTACFSFGGKSAQYAGANGINSGQAGLVLPANGKVLYLTACCINSSGNAPPHAGLSFALMVNGSANASPAQVVEIPSYSRTGVKTMHLNYSLNAGDRINFFSLTANRFSSITIISAFIELDF